MDELDALLFPGDSDGLPEDNVLANVDNTMRVNIPGPRKRTKEHHAIVCGKMREARLSKKLKQERQMVSTGMHEFLNKVRPLIINNKVELFNPNFNFHLYMNLTIWERD